MAIQRDTAPPYFHSYAVFRGLSNDPPKANGKRMVEASEKSRKEQMEMGRKDWQQSMVTVKQEQFGPKPMTNLRYDFKPPGATESTLKLEMDAQRYLQSTVQATYSSQALPPRTQFKSGLRNQSGIVMGEDLPAYRTTYGEQMRKYPFHSDPPREPPIQYNIITNGIKPIQQTAPFDFWNPATSKRRVSKNREVAVETKRTFNILNGRPVG